MIKPLILGILAIAFLTLGCCGATTTSSNNGTNVTDSIEEQLEDKAIDAVLADKCVYSNRTIKQLLFLDGKRYAGEYIDPYYVDAIEYVWSSPTLSDYIAKGHKVSIKYVGANGEITYLFHWDGSAVRYLNENAKRVMNSCPIE